MHYYDASGMRVQVRTAMPLPVTIVASPTPGAAVPEKAEDAAAASGDVGIPAMAIQYATPADKAAEADYAFLQMSAGRLWVRQLDGLSAAATFTPAASSHTAGDCNGAAGTGADAGNFSAIMQTYMTAVGA